MLLRTHCVAVTRLLKGPPGFTPVTCVFGPYLPRVNRQIAGYDATIEKPSMAYNPTYARPSLLMVPRYDRVTRSFLVSQSQAKGFV